MGPRTGEEARRAVCRLTELKASHAYYCMDCGHPQYCRNNPCGHNRPCEVADVYDRAIAAAQAVVEMARVVDGDGA